MSSAAAASPVTSRAARKARGQCSRNNRSRSSTEPRWAPRIQARSATHRLYDGCVSRGPYVTGTSGGPSFVSIGMKRLAFVLAAAALLLPGAARAAACSPLNCAPSQFTLSGGTLIGYRASIGAPVTVADLRTGDSLFSLPPGFAYGSVLVHQA